MLQKLNDPADMINKGEDYIPMTSGFASSGHRWFWLLFIPSIFIKTKHGV